MGVELSLLLSFCVKGWYTPAVTAMNTYLHMLRLFSRDVRLFLVSAAIAGLAWEGARTVLFNIYLLRLGYGPETVGVVTAVGAFSFALLCLPAGAMGTRWGIRNMLITGLGLMVAGHLLLPLTEYLEEAWRMSWLLATTVLTYLGYALYLVNGLPFLMDATGTEERDYAFSVHVALVPLAAFVGSALAGVLPGAFALLLGVSIENVAPYRFPMWLVALLLVPAVLVLLPTRPKERRQARASQAHTPEAPASRAPYALFLIMGLVMAFRFGGRGTITTFFNVYLDQGLGAPTAVIGLLLAAGQLISVPAALAAPLVAARWGNPRIIYWGSLVMALCALPLALVPTWGAAGAGFVSSTLFFSLTVGPIRVFSQGLVAPRWRATMASAFMMGAALAFAAVALIGGYAIVTMGYQALFLVAIGLMAAGGIVFWFWFRVPRGESTHQPAAEVGD